MHKSSECILALAILVLVFEHSQACKRLLSSNSPGPGGLPDGEGSHTPAFLCGLCGPILDVTLIVRNQFQEPFFEYNVTVARKPQRELIYLLQTAADMDPHLKFSADYFGSMGFMITKLNGLAGSVEDKTYWQILEHPSGNTLNLGVSSYVPMDEETVMFNFTTWATGHER